MNGKRTKKYPVLTYLCLTLFVCVMFTGVTFSRYTGMQSGNIESAVSRFACSYDVTDVSATSFINSYYYIKDDKGNNTGKINALRTVNYAIRNYKKDSPTAPCEVGLESRLRISGPYEFISNLAWQIEGVSGETHAVVSPQIVMEDMIDAATTTVDTSKSVSYDARPYEGGKLVTLSGGINDSGGTLTGTWNTSDDPSAGFAGKFELSVYTMDSTYSLTYLRAEIITVSGSSSEQQQTVPGKSVSPIIVDVEEKNARYCTLDIYLPNHMDFSAGKAEEKSFIMSFTIVNSIQAINNPFKTYCVKDENTGAYSLANNAVGYHYDATAAVFDNSGKPNYIDGKLTTAKIRVKRVGDNYTYFKLTEDTTDKIVETQLTSTQIINGKQYLKDEGDNYFYSIEDLQNFERSAQLSAQLAEQIATGIEEVVAAEIEAGFSEEEIAAYEKEIAAEVATTEKTEDYIIGSCTDKSYDLKFRTLFTQSTQSGGDK